MTPAELIRHLEDNNNKEMRRLWNDLSVGDTEPLSIGVGRDEKNHAEAAITVGYSGAIPRGVPASTQIAGQDVAVVARGHLGAIRPV